MAPVGLFENTLYQLFSFDGEAPTINRRKSIRSKRCQPIIRQNLKGKVLSIFSDSLVGNRIPGRPRNSEYRSTSITTRLLNEGAPPRGIRENSFSKGENIRKPSICVHASDIINLKASMV